MPITIFKCTVCGAYHGSLELAESCESQEPRKVAMRSDTGDLWEEGDCVVIHQEPPFARSYNSLRFGVIVGSYVSGHEIIPKVQLTDNMKIIRFDQKWNGVILNPFQAKALVNLAQLVISNMGKDD